MLSHFFLIYVESFIRFDVCYSSLTASFLHGRPLHFMTDMKRNTAILYFL